MMLDGRASTELVDAEVEQVERRRSRTGLVTRTWESLFRTQVTVMRRLVADDIWDEVSVREYDVLFSLTKGDPEGMRLRDLNEWILLTQSSLSRLVERLEQRGLVERSTPADDARGTLVRLTQTGLATQRRVGRLHAQSIERYFGGILSEEELASLGRVLERVRAEVECRR